MREMWFDFWSCMVSVKSATSIPANGRYLCSDWLGDGSIVDYYDIDKDYIVGVTVNP